MHFEYNKIVIHPLFLLELDIFVCKIFIAICRQTHGNALYVHSNLKLFFFSSVKKKAYIIFSSNPPQRKKKTLKPRHTPVRIYTTMRTRPDTHQLVNSRGFPLIVN